MSTYQMKTWFCGLLGQFWLKIFQFIVYLPESKEDKKIADAQEEEN